MKSINPRLIILNVGMAVLLPSVRAAIAALEKRGMWIAPALAARAIHLAGE